MFVVKCSECGKKSKAFIDHVGLRGPCPHCRKRIRITPAAGETSAEGLPAIQPPAGELKRSRQPRSPVPDTSPPAAALLPVAAAATWFLYQVGEAALSRLGLAAAWETLQLCGWIGVAEVLLFLWGMLLVGWKTVLWSRQRRPLRWDIFGIRYQGVARIQPADADRCIAHVQQLVRQPRRLILLNRVCLALDHFRQTRSVQEVRGALTGQAAIDGNLLDSSYAIIRFLIWVLPITGFIGTVVGIGVAVAEFGDFIPAVSDVEQAMDTLREGLGGVARGLATAFNTTLVALVLVAPLMLAGAGLRKFEERLLAEIDHFSNHTLLGRLDDSRRRAERAVHPEPVEAA